MPYKDPKRAAESRARLFGSPARYQRNQDLKIRYGITLAEYDKLVSNQCGACAICGAVPCEDPDAGRNQRFLHVDHDHETGKVRGLICASCNVALGNFKDDVNTMANAIEYLSESAP